MYKGSKVAGRVEREGVCRVGYESRFVVDLAASLKEIDLRAVGSESAALAL